MSHDHPLDGRVALVTGATSGFGLACARSLARAGARVIASGRRAERLAALAAELQPAVHPLPLDVRDGGESGARWRAFPPSSRRWTCS